MRRTPFILLATVALVPALLAGCGSSSSAESSSALAESSAAAESSAPASSPAPESSPAESSPAESSAAASPSGAFDRDAALVELRRQIADSGFSVPAQDCIVEWGTTLSDEDLAEASSEPGTSTPSPEQQAAQAEILVQCARGEVIDLFLTGFAEEIDDVAVQECLAVYMNGLDDPSLLGLLGQDPVAMTALQAAAETCAAGA